MLPRTIYGTLPPHAGLLHVAKKPSVADKCLAVFPWPIKGRAFLAVERASKNLEDPLEASRLPADRDSGI